MRERPILFSAPMVRAILAGRKTQTRRIITPQPREDVSIGGTRGLVVNGQVTDAAGWAAWNRCRYGQSGDRLWVRETHLDLGGCRLYRADPGSDQERELVAPGQKWTPSIHMPRAASRITLEITGVRVERLQDISDADARAEGAAAPPHLSYRDGYAALWESINGPGAWDSNPWVRVVEFRRM